MWGESVCLRCSIDRLHSSLRASCSPQLVLTLPLYPRASPASSLAPQVLRAQHLLHRCVSSPIHVRRRPLVRAGPRLCGGRLPGARIDGSMGRVGARRGLGCLLTLARDYLNTHIGACPHVLRRREAAGGARALLTLARHHRLVRKIMAGREGSRAIRERGGKGRERGLSTGMG